MVTSDFERPATGGGASEVGDASSVLMACVPSESAIGKEYWEPFKTATVMSGNVVGSAGVVDSVRHWQMYCVLRLVAWLEYFLTRVWQWVPGVCGA